MNIEVAVVTHAIPNNKYSLKNLEGHKRIDIIMRNALAALRNGPAKINRFHAVFTNGGILTLHKNQYDYDLLDEIALAALLQKNWKHHFKDIPFDEFLNDFHGWNAVILQKEAQVISTIKSMENVIAFLGAKLDIPEPFVKTIKEKLPTAYASLSKRELLASQAIGLLRIILEEKNK